MHLFWRVTVEALAFTRTKALDNTKMTSPAYIATGVPRLVSWQKNYARRLLITDLIVVTSAVFGSQLLWFGTRAVDLASTAKLGLSYTSVSVIVAGVWMLILGVYGTRDLQVIGNGTLEYKRVLDATVRLFGVFAIVSFLLNVQLARGYFLTALPVGLIAILATRWGWRQWLRRQQNRGSHMSRVLIVGQRANSHHVAQTIRRAQGTGLLIVGAVTRGGWKESELMPGVSVLGGFDDILTAIGKVQADTVILTGSDDISPADMRQLGWDLAARDVGLIVAPTLTDIAGPRIHARPVAGLPLIYVEYPTFDTMKRVMKRSFDLVGASILIALSSPALMAVAIAIKTTSPGTIIYRQERIGQHGQPFGMLKFRSMVSNADDQLKSLLDAQGTSTKPLFKISNDPRITRVGQFIRRTSLDEFPQLFNVLLGQMSLVGPRPQRAAEVALYDDAAHRRLMMKPGMSGLWQVSGRSNLSWDDSVRLDLYYVENWSMTVDLIILWRTFRAVTTAEGAT